MKSQDFKSFLNKIETKTTEIKKQVTPVTSKSTLQTESIPSGLESQLSYIIEQIGFIKSQLSSINNSGNYNQSPQATAPVFKENHKLQNYPSMAPTPQNAFSGPQTQASASMSGEPVDIMAHAGSILA